jgi:hypothetical protein
MKPATHAEMFVDEKEPSHLEHKSRTLGLLVTTVKRDKVSHRCQDGRWQKDVPQLKVLASLECQLSLRLAVGAFES